MKDRLPEFTPVRHKRESYKGWIHQATRMKEIFTGDKDCEWQYSIKVEGCERVKIAPPEDLEIITESAEFPPFLLNEYRSNSGYREETRLRMLGYRITDLDLCQRWNILNNTAIPILGFEEVIRTILDLMFTRLANEEQAIRHFYALTQWKKDVEMVLEKYKNIVKDIDENLLDYYGKICYRLKELVPTIFSTIEKS